ncbi:single-stranded DNA-binding protein [Glutamicibacter ardleyensis]|uniref:single-stranded DNA-binding protein n=1 Tax=Glutamicibacter ardleyensis TaxID=225894 RepID=UPI003FD4E15D
MAGETTITVIGNLTADPELRFTPSGSAVANFTIASTPRTFDRQSNEWKDGEALFLRASVWREQAENVAETFTKGMRVIAEGQLRSRSYDTKEGERRTVMELEVSEIGPSLRFASAKVTRTPRSGGGGNGGNFQPQSNNQPHQNNSPQQGQNGGGGGWNSPSNDPWSTGGNNAGGNNSGGSNGGWGNPGSDEPPF